MLSKIKRVILYLYNLCGVILIIFFVDAVMAPPFQYVSPILLIIGWLLVIALIVAHIALRMVKKKDRKLQKN